MKGATLPLIPQEYKGSWGTFTKSICQKLDILKEMGKFLETLSLPRLNFEEIENLTDLFNKSKDIELIMKNLPTKKSPLSDSLLAKLAKHLKKN